MNTTLLRTIPITVMAILGGLMLTFDVFSGGGNQLGTTIKWGLIGGSVIGLMFPKSGMVLYLISLYYMDFLKRLLVLGDSLTQSDVIFSLVAGPVIVTAACINCSINILAQRIQFRFSDWAFYIACVLVSVLGWFMGDVDNIMVKGQGLIGSAMMGMTALACYCLFRERSDLHRIIVILVIGGIPMALYALWQFVYGIAAWEESYILKGLSPVLYNHYASDGAHHMRPFSTLNLHPTVGAVSGFMAMLSFFVLPKSREHFGATRNKKVIYFLIGCLYLTSMLMAQNRTTYFIPIFFIAFYLFFRTSLGSIIAYVGGAIAAVLIIANSEYLNDNILDWSDRFSRTKLGEGFGTLGTYQARLSGFISMTQAKYWTPFGLSENQIPFSHDPISKFLFRFGYIPLAGAIVAMAFVLFWWHRRYLTIPDLGQRELMAKLTALLAALGVCGAAYGNLLFVSPVNAFMGALIGIGAYTLKREHLGSPILAPAARQAPIVQRQQIA